MVVGLLGLLCAPEINTMQIGAGLYGKQNPVRAQKRNELIIQEMLSKLAPDEILICQEGTADCIPINKEIIKSSETLNGLFEDFDNNNSIPIPINSPIADIKNTFDVIKIYADCLDQKLPEDEISIKVRNSLAKYSADQLIGVCNCYQSLLYPEKLFAFCLSKTKEQLSAIPSVFHSFQRLKPHLQLLMFTPSNIINHLKKTIIKRYENVRKIRLGDGEALVTIWSPNSNKLCAVTRQKINIWNLIDRTHTTLSLPNELTHNIAFSPDSNKIAFVLNFRNIEVLDINTKEYITTLDAGDNLIGNALTFTHDNTGIFYAGTEGPYLMYWKFIDHVYKKPQRFIIPDYHGYFPSIALNSDRTQLAISGHEKSRALILYDMNSLTNITKLGEIPSSDPLEIIAFSPNGEKVIASARKEPETELPQVSVFNITKPNEIRRQWTTEYTNFIGFDSAAFTSDSECILTTGLDNDRNSTLTFWCLNESDGRSYLNLGKGQAVSVAPSHDNSCKIAFAKDHSLFTWTLWTDEEYATLDLLKLYESTDNADQLRLLYDICFKSLNILDKAQLKVFSSLEVTLQQLLVDLFFDNLHKPTPETDSSQKNRFARWFSRWAPSWFSQWMGSEK